MLPYVTLCIGAGIASASLFLAALVQPFVAFLLMFMAPLPLFIVGFSLGSVAALFSALAGALGIGLLLGGINGVSFLVIIGAAPVLLTYFALTARRREATDGSGAAALEWYPLGHLVLWSAAIAGTLMAAFVLLVGAASEDYVKSALELLKQIKEADPQVAQALSGLSDAELETYFSLIARLVPVVAAAGWTVTCVGNIWAASKVVTVSGRSARPWPPFPEMSFPRPASIALGLALAASLLPGTLGRVAEGYASAMVCAFAILGLAVLHDISRKLDGRVFILTTGYLAMVMFNWLAAILFAALGVAETGFNLRRRMKSRSGSPND